MTGNYYHYYYWCFIIIVVVVVVIVIEALLLVENTGTHAYRKGNATGEVVEKVMGIELVYNYNNYNNNNKIIK